MKNVDGFNLLQLADTGGEKSGKGRNSKGMSMGMAREKMVSGLAGGALRQ